MFRRAMSVLAVSASLIVVACGEPPTKELQQAQTAIDAARAAGADRFAREEFTAAEDALKRANDAVAQRDYRLALNNALDARERAQTASRDASGRRAAARKDADRALSAATAALTEARAKLTTAVGARVPAASLDAPRTTITDAESALQKARTAFDGGDFGGASEAATRVAASLRQISRDLESAASSQTHRRRSGPGKS